MKQVLVVNSALALPPGKMAAQARMHAIFIGGDYSDSVTRGIVHSKRMKRLLKIAGIVIAALLLIAIALPFVIDANRFRPMLESRLSAALGREVRVGNLKLTILSGGVTADVRGVHAEAPSAELDFTKQVIDLRGGVKLSRGQGWLTADTARIEIPTGKVSLTQVKGSIPVAKAP